MARIIRTFTHQLTPQAFAHLRALQASHRYFACNIGIHQSDYLVVRIAMSEQEHEFGYHALNSRVVAVYHPGLQQLQPRFVAVHLNRAFEALRDVDHYDATVDKFANALDKPRFLRCIARTKGFHHHCTQPAHKTLDRKSVV